MGVRYPQQKKLQQKISTYQPQSQKTGTGYGLADPYNPAVPDVGGAVAIDMDTVNRPLTPEEEAKAAEAKAKNDKLYEEYEQSAKGQAQPGALQIDPVIGGWAEDLTVLGRPSAEQYKEADDEYKGRNYGYDPYTQDRAGLFGEQNFNPYRQALGAQADKRNAMERQGAYSQLLRSGPISASDRMQLTSEFNQNKITGAFASGHEANQRENQSAMRTGEQNISRGMDVDQANTGAQNQMLRIKGAAEGNRRMNLYMTQKERDLLDKKLKAAAIVADDGPKGKPTFSSWLSDLLS